MVKPQREAPPRGTVNNSVSRQVSLGVPWTTGNVGAFCSN
jgi:hypothetical protein